MTTYASFMIRLWQDQARPQLGHIRGRVEHVQSGVSTTVRSLDEVTLFIKEYLARTSAADTEEEPDEA